MAFGIAALTAGLYLFGQLPSADRASTTGGAPGVVTLLAFGVFLPVTVAFSVFQTRKELVDVRITDADVRFTQRNGRTTSLSWAADAQYVRVWHAIRGPSGKPAHVPGWILEWGRVHGAVSNEIADSLVQRASRVGLDVSSHEEKFAVRGPPSTLQVLEIRRRDSSARDPGKRAAPDRVG